MSDVLGKNVAEDPEVNIPIHTEFFTPGTLRIASTLLQVPSLHPENIFPIVPFLGSTSFTCSWIPASPCSSLNDVLAEILSSGMYILLSLGLLAPDCITNHSICRVRTVIIVHGGGQVENRG